MSRIYFITSMENAETFAGHKRKTPEVALALDHLDDDHRRLVAGGESRPNQGLAPGGP